MICNLQILNRCLCSVLCVRKCMMISYKTTVFDLLYIARWQITASCCLKASCKIEVVQWLSLEWILQNKAGHLMRFTQCSILNRASWRRRQQKPLFVRQRTEKLELHLGREHPFWGFSTDLKTVSCHLLWWLTLSNKLKITIFVSWPSLV